MSLAQPLHTGQKEQLEDAVAMLSAQLELAKSLCVKHSIPADKPELRLAMAQLLATNYLAEISR